MLGRSSITGFTASSHLHRVLINHQVSVGRALEHDVGAELVRHEWKAGGLVFDRPQNHPARVGRNNRRALRRMSIARIHWRHV